MFKDDEGVVIPLDDTDGDEVSMHICSGGEVRAIPEGLVSGDGLRRDTEDATEIYKLSIRPSEAVLVLETEVVHLLSDAMDKGRCRRILALPERRPG